MLENLDSKIPKLLKGKSNALNDVGPLPNYERSTTKKDVKEEKETPKNTMSSNDFGAKKTEPNKTEKPTNEKLQDERRLENMNANAEEKTTLPTVLDPSFGNLKTVMSDSMSCLDHTVNHLHYCMKNVVPRNAEMDLSIRTLDTEKVRTVAYCAEKIIDIMKLKLEAIKVAKEMLKVQ